MGLVLITNTLEESVTEVALSCKTQAWFLPSSFHPRLPVTFTINIEKSNYVIFRPPQKLVNYSINLMINNQTLTYEDSIKYLGIMIDSHLNWKSQVNYISKKIKRNIGILSKLRHYVKTLTNLFYSLISIFDLWSYCLGEHLQINFNPIYQFTKKEFF